MMMIDKISAVVITLNEEHNIANCIKSLKQVANEIIIVDSGSIDDTVNISEKLGATVYIKNWEGYGKTKNFGHSKATFNYILSLDADEVLSTQLKNSIVRIKDEGLSGAYSFNRLTNYCGSWIKHCGWYPDTKVRLFNKKEAFWNEAEVHEELVLKTKVPIKNIDGDILHYSFNSVKTHKEKVKKYALLSARKMKEKNKLTLVAKTLTNPIIRFIRTYVFQLGFMDGINGLKICLLMSYEVFLKYYWATFKSSPNISKFI